MRGLSTRWAASGKSARICVCSDVPGKGVLEGLSLASTFCPWVLAVSCVWGKAVSLLTKEEGGREGGLDSPTFVVAFVPCHGCDQDDEKGGRHDKAGNGNEEASVRGYVGQRLE